MAKFQRHVFVCQNERSCEDPRGCCLARGGAQVLEALKAALKAKNLKPEDLSLFKANPPDIDPTVREELSKVILKAFQQFREFGREEKAKIVFIVSGAVTLAQTLDPREPKFRAQLTAAYDQQAPAVEPEPDVPLVGKEA